MADSGVTPEGIKATLREKLEATYVEIEDMSGIQYPRIPLKNR